MSLPAQLFTLAGLLALPAAFARSRRFVRNTTLTAAWCSALPAAIVWSAAAVADRWLHLLRPPAADCLWYAAGVSALLPPVAVLGARRPANRAWPWFVLLPLAVVFLLPVVTTFYHGLGNGALLIEPPYAIGFALVLIMGAGNFIGTRFTLPAVLYAAAAVLAVLPETGWADSGSAGSPLRDWALVCGAVAELLLVWILRRPGPASPGGSFRERVDLLWNDFFDAFGIVWARRVQERINDVARRENWPVRLDLTHLVDHKSESDLATARPQIERALRWLLRRFVDPPWIDARLGGTEDAPPETPADSPN